MRHIPCASNTSKQDQAIAQIAFFATHPPQNAKTPGLLGANTKAPRSTDDGKSNTPTTPHFAVIPVLEPDSGFLRKLFVTVIGRTTCKMNSGCLRIVASELPCNGDWMEKGVQNDNNNRKRKQVSI